MNFTVFTEGNEDVEKGFTKVEQGCETVTSTIEMQCENKEKINPSSKQDLLTPDINITIKLLREDEKIRKYELTFKISNEQPFRVYEVENLVIGKPVEYLYKNSILNIIRNKVLQNTPMELKLHENKSIIEIYKNKLNKILQN